MAALVGPNGAGKTTLLHMAVGLLTPTTGSVRVFGAPPQQARQRDWLRRPGSSALSQLHRGRDADDGTQAESPLGRDWRRPGCDDFGVPLDRPVGKLSGGQQAQLALTLALAKQPDILLLDEPVASLDPLARRDFLRALAEIGEEGRVTVLLSSHIIADLERVCDYLIILSAAQVQLVGEISEIARTHKRLTAAQPRARRYRGCRRHHRRVCDAAQTQLLVRTDGPLTDPGWEVADVSLEEIVLPIWGIRATTHPSATPTLAQMEVSQ